MRILIVSPYGLRHVGGNVVTLQRIQKGLLRRGHRVQIAVPAEGERADLLEEAIRSFRADVVHGYHAYRTGRYLAGAQLPPTVVTVSGTDLNEDCGDEVRREVVRRALSACRRILAAGDAMGERVRALFPDLASKVRVVAKGVSVGDAPYDLGLAPGDEPVFLPAGIRPVKDPLFAVKALDPVAAELPSMRLLMAGPVLDEEYGRLVLGEVTRRPWARHIGSIPNASMGTAYRRARVVLNTSRSEGLSNTIMEAMWCGAEILASDIPGNRALIEEGRTGHLYRGEEDFRAKMRVLLRGEVPRLGPAAAVYASEHFSAEREAEDLEKAYAEAAGIA